MNQELLLVIRAQDEASAIIQGMRLQLMAMAKEAKAVMMSMSGGFTGTGMAAATGG